MTKESIDHIVAGALFDFAGFLTSRPCQIKCSSHDNATPMVEAIKEFARLRGLALHDAHVMDWPNRCAQGVINEHVDHVGCALHS